MYGDSGDESLVEQSVPGVGLSGPRLAHPAPVMGLPAPHVDHPAHGVGDRHEQGSATHIEGTAAIAADTANLGDVEEMQAARKKRRFVVREGFWKSEKAKKEHPMIETNEIYVQMKKRFQRLLKSQLADVTHDKKLELEKMEIIALLSQYFRNVLSAAVFQAFVGNLTLVLQGLLAGLAVAHSLFALVFAQPKILVEDYRWMATLTQAAFYFGCVVSTVNALDRFSVGESFLKTIKKLLLLQGGSFAVYVWILGSATCVFMTAFDEYIAENNYELLTANNSIIFDFWRYSSLFRSGCVVVGWLFTALQPNANFTRDRLHQLAGVHDLLRLQKQLLHQVNTGIRH